MLDGSTSSSSPAWRSMAELPPRKYQASWPARRNLSALLLADRPADAAAFAAAKGRELRLRWRPGGETTDADPTR